MNAPAPEGLVILGSTGSIGKSTLDVVARHAERYRVVALAARRSWQVLAEQCRQFRPEYAVVTDPEVAASLSAALSGLDVKILVGAAALDEVAALPQAPIVMAAIVGAAGLNSTLAAVRAGKRLLLANKESLVMAGPLVMREVTRCGAVLLPVDSEHNAIFQCLPHGTGAGTTPPGVRRVLLTASGGPFLRLPAAELGAVTPARACAHPRWVMGRKISVDSATLMNKGLELIEAELLFGLAHGKVEVVVHPESIVHSMVEYVDGSVLAQLGNPDMRVPIAHALAWPARIESGVESLDLVRRGSLAFEAPDYERFPCLGLAQAAAASGGTAPAVLNAANEVAVGAFLEERLNFTRIPAVIEVVLGRHQPGRVDSLDDILGADAWARHEAEREVAAARGECA